jgi:hypothetical protein
MYLLVIFAMLKYFLLCFSKVHLKIPLFLVLLFKLVPVPCHVFKVLPFLLHVWLILSAFKIIVTTNLLG